MAESSPGDSWSRFLSEHPELHEPLRLEFTERELARAVLDAEREWEQHWRARGYQQPPRCVRGVSSGDVASFMIGRPLGADASWSALVPRHGDVVRIGRALSRLEGAGTLVRVSRSWDSPPRWSVEPMHQVEMACDHMREVTARLKRLSPEADLEQALADFAGAFVEQRFDDALRAADRAQRAVRRGTT